MLLHLIQVCVSNDEIFASERARSCVAVDGCRFVCVCDFSQNLIAAPQSTRQTSRHGHASAKIENRIRKPPLRETCDVSNRVLWLPRSIYDDRLSYVILASASTPPNTMLISSAASDAVAIFMFAAEFRNHYQLHI